MARKPNPGGDRNAWGGVLNDYLDKALNPDGSVKAAAVADAVTTQVETSLSVQLPPAVESAMASSETLAAAVGTAVENDPVITLNTSDISTLKLGDTRINLRSEGLSLDGMTDETAAFQAVLDNAPVGAVISMDDRANLRLSGQVFHANKPLTIDGRGGKMKWDSKRTDPLFYIQNVPDFRIMNLDIEGAETAFDGVFDTQAFALFLHSCPDAIVSNIRARNVSRGLNATASQRLNIDGWSYFGMVSALDLNVNFNSGIRLMGSHDSKLSRIYAENCGSTLLVGSTSERGQVVMASGKNTFDNGIYISSGIGWEVVGPQFTFDASITSNRGTGVKMRGSDNTLLGGTFTRMGVGAVITGTGGAVMADGFDGRGSRIIGAKAIDPYNVGFSIEAATEAPCRDGSITSCYVEGHGWSGNATVSAIRALTGKGHLLAHNHILANANSASALSHIIASGVSGSPLTGIQIVGNTVRNAAGQTAISAANVNRVRIIANTLEAISADYGIRLINSIAGEVTDNYAIGTVGAVAGIRVNDAVSDLNNVYDNINVTISDAGTSTNKFGNGNGNPTVVANATDLASAIALINDMKVKLQAQKVFG